MKAGREPRAGALGRAGIGKIATPRSYNDPLPLRCSLAR